MPEITTLQDGLGSDGIYRLHLVSDAAIEYPVPAHAVVERSVEAGTHVLKGEWVYRGACELSDRWQVVLWGMLPGERVSEQAIQAARLYELVYGFLPPFAWVRELPAGIALGQPIPFGDDDLGLFDATFVPVGFLAVGDGMVIESRCNAPGVVQIQVQRTNSGCNAL